MVSSYSWSIFFGNYYKILVVIAIHFSVWTTPKLLPTTTYLSTVLAKERTNDWWDGCLLILTEIFCLGHCLDLFFLSAQLKFNLFSDSFILVFAILVHWHTCERILTRSAGTILVKISIEMWNITMIAMISLNV